MYKKTRLIALALAGVMLALAACSSSSKSSSAGGAAGGSAPSTSGTAGSSPATGASSIKIGVSFYTKAIPLYVVMQQGMQDKAKQLGASIEFSYADNSAETQSNQIANFITKGVSIILASPVDAKALVPAYQQAHQAHIPIISVANKVDDQYEDAYVGPDLVNQAKQTMDRLAKAIGGNGDILAITGPPQITFVQLQQMGWQQSLAQNPGVKIVQTLVDPDLSKSNAVDLANSGLTAHASVKGIIGSDDDIGLGALQAVQSRGLDPKKIFIASWDGQQSAIDAVKSGNYGLTLSEKGYSWGQVAVQTAVDWVNGKKPAGHQVLTTYSFIDASNVNTLTDADTK